MSLSQALAAVDTAAKALAAASFSLGEVIKVNTSPVLFGTEVGADRSPPIIQDGDTRLNPAAATVAAEGLMANWPSVRADMIAAGVPAIAAAKQQLDAAWAAAVAEYGDGSGPFE